MFKKIFNKKTISLGIVSSLSTIYLFSKYLQYQQNRQLSNKLTKLHFYNNLFTKTWKILITSLLLNNNKVQCLQTIRTNKSELIKLLSTTKQQIVILVYNRQNQQELKQQILKLQDQCQQQQIKSMLLVDQTDLRHLQTFAKIVRDQDGEQYQKEPVDLGNQIKIFYVNPHYNTNKPFVIASRDSLHQQLSQIRNIFHVNPTVEQLLKSFSTFNRTTIFKKCYNQTCIEQFREKVRQLIQLQLFRGKTDNYGFYTSSNKTQQNKLSTIFQNNLLKSSNKQQIYLHYNDILGKQNMLYTQWLDKYGKDIVNSNRFLMFIRPRVHLISKSNYYTDMLWYMSALRNGNVPTFVINSLVKKQYIQEWKNNPMKDDVQLLREIKQKYGNKIHLMVVETRAMSELIRHIYLPWRYVIFQIKTSVPYPKMKLNPKLDKQGVIGQQFWENINRFMDKPKNYNPVRHLGEKQFEVNAQKLLQILEKSQNNQKPSQQSENKQNIPQKWVLRMCGRSNDCQQQNVYQKYNLNLGTKVYKLDANIHNVGLNQGDYYYQNGQLYKFDE